METVETQKPFACKAKDCHMSFTNEDHLNVHERKHEMNLNLGLVKNPAFVADQTPTPTRLIKNCEEVGLFDDLKHVNPFDETFRRAVECNISTNSPSIGGGGDCESDERVTSSVLTADPSLLCDNSLHTPQVFPITDNLHEENQIIVTNTDTTNCPPQKDKTEQIERSSSSIEDIQKKDLKSYQSKDRIRKRIKQHLQKKPPVLLPKTYINIQQPQIIAVHFAPTTILQQQSSRPFILPKLINQTNKEILNTNSNCPTTGTACDSGKSKSSVQVKYSSRNSKKDSSKQLYDNDSMERRRAAAMRYRKKMKKEQINLRRRNEELLTENTELKRIVTDLKQTLLSHQNCNLTKSGLNVLFNEKIVNVKTPLEIPGTFKLIMNVPKIIVQNK